MHLSYYIKIDIEDIVPPEQELNKIRYNFMLDLNINFIIRAFAKGTRIL